MNEQKRILNITNGIVIDHLPVGSVWKIAQILELEKDAFSGNVTLGDNYQSKKLGKKGILKVESYSLHELELDRIALIARDATVSYIEQGKIKQKRKVRIPQTLENLVHCNNSNCITNDKHEKIHPKIYFNNEQFTCHYCESSFTYSDLKLV